MDVAGRRGRAAELPGRRRPLPGWPASRPRRRRPGRLRRASAGGGHGGLRRTGSRCRSDGDDPHRGRLLDHARAPRLRGRADRDAGRGGRRRRHSRPERRQRACGALRAPRCAGHGRAARVRRSADTPATTRERDRTRPGGRCDGSAPGDSGRAADAGRDSSACGPACAFGGDLASAASCPRATHRPAGRDSRARASPASRDRLAFGGPASAQSACCDSAPGEGRARAVRPSPGHDRSAGRCRALREIGLAALEARSRAGRASGAEAATRPDPARAFAGGRLDRRRSHCSPTAPAAPGEADGPPYH